MRLFSVFFVRSDMIQPMNELHLNLSLKDGPYLILSLKTHVKSQIKIP